jgi:hypothetical protein
MANSLGVALLVQSEQTVQKASHRECSTSVQQQEEHRPLAVMDCLLEMVVLK